MVKSIKTNNKDNVVKLFDKSISKLMKKRNQDRGIFESVSLNDLGLNNEIHDPKNLVRDYYKKIGKSKAYKRAVKCIFRYKKYSNLIGFHDPHGSLQTLGLAKDSYNAVKYLPSGSFTLVATDPIYFMDKYYKPHHDKVVRDEKRNGKANVEHMHKGFRLSVLDQFVRLCRGNTINILLCVSVDMVGLINNYFAKHYGCSLSNRHINDIAFIKGNAGRNRFGIRINEEHCLYIHKNIKFRNNSYKYHLATTGYMMPTNQAEEHILPHGTVKPLFIIKNLLQMASDIELPDGVTTNVLDPFCGTGTTAVACKMLGFDGTFFDRDKEHAIEPSIKRLLAPVPVDWALIDAEADHLKRMQTEFTKLMKCNYESIKTSLRDYQLRRDRNRSNIHKTYKDYLLQNRILLIDRLVTDDKELHYIQTNPKLDLSSVKSALHIESVHPKKQVKAQK